MAKLPESLHSTVRAIERVHVEREAKSGPRDYLGGSLLGHACQRFLWLTFRHAEYPQWSGRMLRLFDTGHRQEARLIEELRAAGVTVSDRDDRGNQHEVVDCDGHVKGHLDGAALGLLEAPKTWHLLEVKTHNAKSYADVVKNGVLKSKPQHYAQMQFYMGHAKLDRAAYFAINKDTDDIHLERVEFDSDCFASLRARASNIVALVEPPPRISDDPAWHECRGCTFYDLCHGTRMPRAGCRTCAHSTPAANGTWNCVWHNATIPFATQLTGCEDHRYIPTLVDRVLELAHADGNNIAWRIVSTGAVIEQPGYASKEMRNADSLEFLGLQWAQDYKRVFGARIVPRGDAYEPQPSTRPPHELGDDDIPF